jgi:DNA-binding protein H-NS
MNLDSLEKLGDVELRAVVARAEELLAQHDRERKDKALEQARAILSGVGLSLKDVAKPHKNGSKGPAYHGGRQYQHPTDKTKVWAARGQKPQWVRELESEGKRPVEIPANDNISTVKKTA